MSKTERLYLIQRMLTGNACISTERFLQVLEISRATLKRDLEYLRDRLGAPIVWDAERGGYRFDTRHDHHSAQLLPGLWLTEEEISGLLMSVELLAALEPGALTSEQIRPIRERLEKLLELSNFSVSEIRQRIKLSPIGQRTTAVKHFQTIALAALARKRLTIRHFGRRDATLTEREISPLRLVRYKDNWYLDAFCHLRNDLRSFAIDAIEEVVGTDKAAVAIDETMLAQQIDAGYGIFAGKDLKRAILRFTPFRARWVANETWHPEQRGTLLPDGSFELDLPYLDDRELLHDILKEGSEVVVMAPPELRAKVQDELRKALDGYTARRQ